MTDNLGRVTSPGITAACRTCGEVLDAWTPTSLGREPENGDAAMCMRCGVVSVFNGVHLREPTREEMATIVVSPGYQHIRYVLAHLNADRG